MELIRATEQELDELLAFYQHTADRMEESGLQHWHWGCYPTADIIREDVGKGNLYVMRTADGTLAAAVALMAGQEPEYDALQWSCGTRPGVFHRLAVNPSMQGTGLGGRVLEDVMEILRRSGCDCVRCDTLEKNRNAIRLYEKFGFRPCDRLRWEDSFGENIALDKPLKQETPLCPIPMKPAFRCGEKTPWGGTRLRERFGKETADNRTGESMEVSCIPGLESRDALGRTLPDLIREFGEKLVGNYADRPFPLLLKFLDVEDRLSVQVHPDDEYAASRENGKFGKTEAWMVLETAPGGRELIYGVRPGTTLQALREASEKGAEVETLLNRVRVSEGDVCYIPAGCIHSAGNGIVLYEIQQSSDVTYRFYDWNRTDANGRKRELHLDKALDVTDLRCEPAPIHVEKAFGVRRILSEKHFTLDVIRTDSMEILPPVHEFGILTVTEGTMEIRFTGGSVRMKAGDTCLLPKTVPELTLAGEGAAALAMPAE